MVRIHPARADRDLLGSTDVIVIDHAGKLSDETIQLLVGLSRRGFESRVAADKAASLGGEKSNRRQLPDSDG